MLNLLKKQIFKKNHYSGSFLDPENGWFISAQFEKFKQIWAKGRTLKLKKKKKIENSICFGFRLSTYLLLYVPYVQNFIKMHACEATGGAKFG